MRLKSHSLLLAGASIALLLTTGCSNFSQAARQQRAYAKYIAKCSHTRVKQQAKFKKVKVPAATVQAPIITAESQGPLSVGSNAPN